MQKAAASTTGSANNVDPEQLARTTLVRPLATSMPNEPAPLNTGNDRVRAAMRVLGTHEKDLQKQPREKFHSEIAFELYERKRRILASNVNDLVKDSPEAGSIPGLGEKVDPNAAFMAEVLAIEKKNIEKMNLMAKKEIQSVMIRELEEKHANEMSVKKQEESLLRQKDLQKARDEKLKLLQKEAQKRADRVQDARARADRHMAEEAEALQNHLNEKDEQVTKKLQEIADGRVEMRVRAEEKRAQALVRKDEFEQGLLNEREKAYQTIKERDQKVEARLAQKLSDSRHNSALFAEKLAGCTQRARAQLEANQARHEANFLKREKEHKAAEELRNSNAAAALKDFKTKNSKERSSFESRWDRMQKDFEENPNVSRRLLRMEGMDFASTGCLLRPEYHHMAHSNKSMTDLVEFNNGLLRKAHAYHQEHQLEKIKNMRARVKAMMDSKQNAATRRMAMIKNVAIEKHELAHKVERARAAGPAKLNKILGDLDPDPEAEAKINELLKAMNMDLLPGTKVDDEA